MGLCGVKVDYGTAGRDHGRATEGITDRMHNPKVQGGAKNGVLADDGQRTAEFLDTQGHRTCSRASTNAMIGAVLRCDYDESRGGQRPGCQMMVAKPPAIAMR